MWRYEDIELLAEKLIKLWLAASGCMIFSLVSAKVLNVSKNPNTLHLNDKLFGEVSNGFISKLTSNLVDFLFLLIMLFLVSVALMLLYKFQWDLLICSVFKVFIFGLLILLVVLYAHGILEVYNKALDFFTLVVICWNFSMTGMIILLQPAPFILVQGYLLLLANFLALLSLKFLNKQIWVLIVAITCWDLNVVLCKNGPTNILINLITQRNHNANFSVMIFPIESSPPINNGISRRLSSASHATQNSGSNIELQEFNVTTETNNDDHDVSESSNVTNNSHECNFTIQIGLIDLIVYSILLAKSSVDDKWSSVISCYFGIILGLSCTYLFLIKWNKPLPALPMPVTCGLGFTFVTTFLIDPFIEIISANQTFI